MEIEKKVWSKFFEKIKSGEKTFEVRLADTEYKVGDVLVLKEWDPDNNKYTGREIRKTITYVLLTKNMHYWPEEEMAKKGFVVMGFH
jgi:ASC-1-like (ASCH) protein